MANPVTIPEDSPFFQQIQTQNELLGRFSDVQASRDSSGSSDVQQAASSGLKKPVNSMVSGIDRMVELLTGIESTERNLLEQVQSGLPRAIQETDFVDTETVERLQSAELSTSRQVEELTRQQREAEQKGPSSVTLENATETDATLGEVIRSSMEGVKGAVTGAFSQMSSFLGGDTSLLGMAGGLAAGGASMMETLLPAMESGVAVADLRRTGVLSRLVSPITSITSMMGTVVASIGSFTGITGLLSSIGTTLSSMFSLLGGPILGPILAISTIAASITNIADWFTGGEFSSQTRSAIQGVPILGAIFNMLTGIPLIGGILEDTILPFAKLGMEAWQLLTNPSQFAQDLGSGLAFLFTDGAAMLGNTLVSDLPPALWSMGKSVLSGMFDFFQILNTIRGTIMSLPFDIVEGFLRGLGNIPYIGPVFSGLANLIGPLGDFIESPFSSMSGILSSVIPSPSDIGSAVVSGFSFLQDLRAQFINFMTRIPTMIPQAILSGLSGFASQFGFTEVASTLNSLSSGISVLRKKVASFLTNPVSFIFNGLMKFWNMIKSSIPFVGGEEGGGKTRKSVKETTGSEGLAEASEAASQTVSGFGNIMSGNILTGTRQVATGAGTGTAETASGFTEDLIFGQGGVIREPVTGVTASGKKVKIAESGPEAVVPLPKDAGSGESEPGARPVQPEPARVQTGREAPMDVTQEAEMSAPDTRPELQNQSQKLDQMINLLQELVGSQDQQSAPPTNLKNVQPFELDQQSRMVVQGAF